MQTHIHTNSYTDMYIYNTYLRRQINTHIVEHTELHRPSSKVEAEPPHIYTHTNTYSRTHGSMHTYTANLAVSLIIDNL